MNSLLRQRGVALITAIILVAIAAVLATAIGYASAMSARRASTQFGSDQAYLAAPAYGAALAKLGRTDDARRAIESLLGLDAQYSVKSALRRHPYRDAKDRDKLADALARAGLS